MKRTIKYALTAVMSAVLVAPAVAQDNFPDVPDNHWAYEALSRLKKEGLLVGYPDGLFRGGRPASRYEMAVALHALYQYFKNLTDGLNTQIEALKGAPTGNPAELQAMKDQIAALQNDVNALKGTDFATVRRLVDNFQKELQALGVDVEAMKKDIADLQSRVDALEKRKPAVDISGDLNLWVGGGHSIDHEIGLNKDGRLIGVEGGNPVGLTQDLSVLHEAALTFKGTNETGPQWRATLVVGNTLRDGANAAFGDYSTVWGGAPYGDPSTDIYFNELAVKFNSSVSSLGFNAEIGRLGYQISPILFKRADTTTYYANDRWDNGNWYLDGAVVGLNFGSVKVNVIGGLNSERTTTNGIELNPMIVGATPGVPGVVNSAVPTGNQLLVGRSLGAHVNLPLSKAGSVDLAYLFLAGDAANAIGAGRLDVFGGEAKFKLAGLDLVGGYGNSKFMKGDTTVLDTENDQWYAGLGYESKSWGIGGLYRSVGANYAAPGDWGRVGIVTNLVNVEGFEGKAHLSLGSSLKLSAMGGFWKGRDDLVAQTGIDKDTEILSLGARADWQLNDVLGLFASYEDSRFKKTLGLDNEATYKYATVGFGYTLSEKSKLSLAYEYGSVNRDTFITGVSPTGRYKGGFLTTQLSVKF